MRYDFGQGSWPEHDHCGKCAGREEQVGASVVARNDPAPVLEAGVHVLDFVSGSVESRVMRDRNLSVLSGRAAWLNIRPYQRITELTGVIAPIRE